MPTYRTPDVYVEEIQTFPPSVAEVGTSIPAFIGWTDKATKANANDLLLKPTKVYSIKEYEALFGLPHAPDIAVSITETAGVVTSTAVVPPTTWYLLYHAVKMFFDNGGAQCYVISVGTYAATPSGSTFTLIGDATTSPVTGYGLQDGLDALALEDEPTLIVIPEAVKLSSTDYATLAQAVLAQCNRLRDRFAIFDIHGGGATLDAAGLLANRGYFGNNHLKYGAAYYPFLKTSFNHAVNDAESNVKVTYTKDGTATGPAGLDTFKSGGTNANTAIYNLAKLALKDHYITLPPSAAVAGIYAATDSARGVWKAPANMSLADVIEPVVKLDNLKQEDFNVDATTGKSINALRAFAGKGTLVWGARTLAGNDNEWRYVSVRRFFSVVEESIKKSTYWAVFEPNDANTWVKVRGMIENYLTDKWREGALAGAAPKDAFFVKCGLGSTMNAQDILEGRLNVEVGMAVVRPAEFIVLKFSHKLQTS
ncbi:phage tail sheath subtilisin-like domain-containing protein [Myxococcus stipitatus]|uniref:phage tail sheath family protein n=1 Tax=Myxococcus stipitatus TaxID=83455 RepID=UPI001F2E55C7|nr:phage tail sheath C-terminal domain-containing protein [Myxococcus stipitatus]MCE9667743.1 phage tail sheath subtilisin-like domain-containing protein [Myxococcus stipitatus]